jgi:hypothetical protein
MHPQDSSLTHLHLRHRHDELLREAERSRRLALATTPRPDRLGGLRQHMGTALIALGSRLAGEIEPVSRRCDPVRPARLGFDA